ncbi:segregation and condensation protein A [Thermaurantiacus sp.]
MRDGRTPAERAGDEVLHVAVEAWEGPLDLLLALARTNRVDLRAIPILPLVDQYLAFIGRARALRLELAADYLVMAAWLAYLKSALLLPEPGPGEVDAEAMAERLRWRLARLAAMRDAAAALVARDLLGRDVFARGAPEGLRRVTRAKVEASLYELLSAYGGIAAMRERRCWTPPARPVLMTLEEAIARVEAMLGERLDWTRLAEFLPGGLEGQARSGAMAAGFAAALELVRRGRVELAQAAPFAPLMLRARPG